MGVDVFPLSCKWCGEDPTPKGRCGRCSRVAGECRRPKWPNVLNVNLFAGEDNAKAIQWNNAVMQGSAVGGGLIESTSNCCVRYNLPASTFLNSTISEQFDTVQKRRFLIVEDANELLLPFDFANVYDLVLYRNLRGIQTQIATLSWYYRLEWQNIDLYVEHFPTGYGSCRFRMTLVITGKHQYRKSIAFTNGANAGQIVHIAPCLGFPLGGSLPTGSLPAWGSDGPFKFFNGAGNDYPFRYVFTLTRDKIEKQTLYEFLPDAYATKASCAPTELKTLFFGHDFLPGSGAFPTNCDFGPCQWPFKPSENPPATWCGNSLSPGPCQPYYSPPRTPAGAIPQPYCTWVSAFPGRFSALQRERVSWNETLEFKDYPAAKLVPELLKLDRWVLEIL